MKKKYSLASALLSSILLLFASSCSKNDNGGSPNPSPNNASIPVLTSTAITNITTTSAQSGGTITSDGGAPVTARGVCYSYLPNPTLSDNKTNDGTGTGSFVSNMTSMPVNQGFYLRAYATNSKGTGYGNELYFVTSGAPSITTTPVSEINHIWTSGGTGIYSSQAPVTEKGICWATTHNPTIADNKTSDGIGTSSFTTRIIPSINTTYYVRAYATNSFGTGYGNEVTFTTGIAIGLSYGGGIIFDVDGSGLHGLIAATTDQSTAIPWAPGSLFTTITNASSSTNGSANTTQIISVYGNSGSYAAKLCRDYRGGNYTDWFLPSNDQLFKLSGFQDVVGGFPTPCFLCTFNYWSSTEYDYFRAWDQNFNYGSSFNNPQKNQLNYVRAVRVF